MEDEGKMLRGDLLPLGEGGGGISLLVCTKNCNNKLCLCKAMFQLLYCFMDGKMDHSSIKTLV